MESYRSAFVTADACLAEKMHKQKGDGELGHEVKEEGVSFKGRGHVKYRKSLALRSRD